MHIYGILLLLTLSAFHSTSDAAEENLVSNNLESQHNVVAPSRVKRNGMNILRLGRTASAGGFPNDYPQFQDQDRDDALALEKISEELQSPYLYEISPNDYYQALSSLQDSYSHSRYRRSTPADDMMVTPVPLVDDSGADGLKIDGSDDDDSYLLYQDFADDDSVVVDDDGKAWDVKTGEELSKRGLNMLRLGKRDNRSTKRLNMLRLGKRENENEKRNLNMLRLGKRQMESFNSEFGAPSDLSSLGQNSKRFPMLRVGKREDENEKRNLNMLRLGKRQMNMLRLGKRQMNMLRLGKRQMNMLRLGKRQLNMLRLGKRQLNMLRLGKREDADDNTAAKRNLQMLRLGKRQEDDVEKRNLHMLRLGKRSVENAPVNKAE